jgi:hypothetical protein
VIVMAHVGGVPLEEMLPSVTALLMARVWIMVRVRRRREPGR